MSSARLGIFVIPHRYQDWNELADSLERGGISSVTLALKDSQGMMFTPSSVAPSVTDTHSVLAEGIEVLRARGLQIRVSIAVFNDFVAALKYPEWLAVRDDGAPARPGGAWTDWRESNYWHLCPSRTDVLERVLIVVSEFVSNHYVDELALDFIRFPFQNARSAGDREHWFCYCEVCTHSFGDRADSMPPRGRPENTPEWRAWIEWRQGQILNAVEAIASVARSGVNPELGVSPFLALYGCNGSAPEDLRARFNRFGQDPYSLSAVASSLSPMAYHKFVNGLPIEYTRQPLFWIKNVSRLIAADSTVPIVTTVQGEDPLTADELEGAVGNAFNGGASHVLIYPGFTWRLPSSKWEALRRIGESLSTSQAASP